MTEIQKSNGDISKSEGSPDTTGLGLPFPEHLRFASREELAKAYPEWREEILGRPLACYDEYSVLTLESAMQFIDDQTEAYAKRNRARHQKFFEDLENRIGGFNE